MRVVRASLMFLKISNLVYDIFRLACVQFPKNAVVFERQMPLFDLHLGEGEIKRATVKTLANLQ